ncbi:hypothetical protein G6F56_002294 [Rhizopus delemar]|uniref:SWIRM domain-containing protein n=1 Tax=Rhizopus stolonifer TaxID=4846 RepID=A0A367KQD8_RHIST|nr:hypothetical protein G6F56_002294 [Rhizopus delemar]RCI04367.1 hypothetical protein CU098_013006 [Rhizopus stolonifer]
MSQSQFIKSVTEDILSPPTTPKRNTETYFHSQSDKIMHPYHCFMEQHSSQSPPYSPPMAELSSDYTGSSLCIVQPLSLTTWVNDLHTPLHRRKQRPSSPMRSVTKNTFTLPIQDLLRRPTTSSVSCNGHKSLSDQTKKRKYKFMNCATKKKLSCLAKAKTRNNTRNYCGPFMFLTENTRQENTQEVSKSMKDDAQFFDHATADDDIAILFKGKEDWIPKPDVFENRASIRIAWKGSPLKIQSMPYFEKLHVGEVPIAATLRLTPEQYLKCKYALILAAHKATEENTMFRKSEAQKACCIDVNKASVLWKVFGKLGWLGTKWPN